MSSRFAVDAVDRFLRFLMNNNAPMGGKVVVFGGDFRQTLPVVPHGHRAEIIFATIKSSHLWSNLFTFRLTINMRQRTSIVNEQHQPIADFAQWLLRLGEGSLPHIRLKGAQYAQQDLIEIPIGICVDSLFELLAFVYGDLLIEGRRADDDLLLGGRAILCPTNASVDEINNKVVSSLSQNSPLSFFSVDDLAANPNDDVRYPIDLLHSIDVPSLPPHELKLHVGAVVMLVRNVDVSVGLCNGTRLLLISLGQHLLEAKVLSGQSKGQIVFIPRIKISCSTTIVPGTFLRLQFPIRLAFAMTINKSQGQTFQKVGICLTRPCFSHGQLYVALSRVGLSSNVRLHIENSLQQGNFNTKNRKFTRNVVYTSVFNNCERDALLGKNPPERDMDVLEEVVLEHWAEDNIKDLFESIDEDALMHISDFHKWNQNDFCLSFAHVPEAAGNHPILTTPLRIAQAILDIDEEPYDENQLKDRVSVLDRPGTSGVKGHNASSSFFNVHFRPLTANDDSDSD